MTTQIAFIFPGQGSQYVGMGKELYQSYPLVKEIYQKAETILGFSLCELCFNGPEELLRQTKNTQPAIFTISLTFLEVIKTFKITPLAVAGHSLGEYSALVSASSLSFEEGLKLVVHRGELMQKVGTINQGSMAAIIGLEKAMVQKICEEADVFIANFNSPLQIVISGKKENILKAIDNAKTKGAKTILLPVSGAFHSPLMQPMVEEFTNKIEKINFSTPMISFIPNVLADYVKDEAQIKHSLINQITHSVRWTETIQKMISSGINIFIEIGPGKVLSGLVRKISNEVVVLNIEDALSLEKTIKYINEAV